jgi:hypothetical protein
VLQTQAVAACCKKVSYPAGHGSHGCGPTSALYVSTSHLSHCPSVPNVYPKLYHQFSSQTEFIFQTQTNFYLFDQKNYLKISNKLEHEESR